MKPIRSLQVLGLMIWMFAFAACDDGGGGGSGGNGGNGGNGSSSGSSDPCAGLGCASIVSPLLLTVVDATTGAFIENPIFTWNSNSMAATCFPSPDGGAA